VKSTLPVQYMRFVDRGRRHKGSRLTMAITREKKKKKKEA